MAELDLTQAITIAGATSGLTLLAGSVTAYFNYRLALRKDRLLKEDELRRAGNYLAIRVVCILDEFIDGCVEVVYDDGIPDGNGETGPRLAAPKLEFPSDVDWKTVRHDLMYRALALPNFISAADEAISFAANELAGPPDHEEFFEERAIRYCEIGLKALELSADFRAKYGIPARELAEHYEPKKRLIERLGKVQGYVNAKAEAQALSYKQMADAHDEQKKADAAPKDSAG